MYPRRNVSNEETANSTGEGFPPFGRFAEPPRIQVEDHIQVEDRGGCGSQSFLHFPWRSIVFNTGVPPQQGGSLVVPFCNSWLQIWRPWILSKGHKMPSLSFLFFWTQVSAPDTLWWAQGICGSVPTLSHHLPRPPPPDPLLHPLDSPSRAACIKASRQ